MTNEFLEYGMLFDEDAETPQFKLETIALRLSHIIADAMRDCGMTRTDLAHSLGVSAPMVTKILSGNSNFTLKTLVGLADVLGYEFDPVFRPREYAVADDYVFSAGESHLGGSGTQATHTILNDNIEAAASMQASGLIGWDLGLCAESGDEPLLRAVA